MSVMQSMVCPAGRIGQFRFNSLRSLVGMRHFATTTKNPTSKPVPIKKEPSMQTTTAPTKKVHQQKSETKLLNNTITNKNKDDEYKITNTTKTNPSNKSKEGMKETKISKPTHTPPASKKTGKTAPTLSKGKTIQVAQKAKGKMKLAPQVGDIESKRKKEIPPAEQTVKGEKINEVIAKGELVKDEDIATAGEVVKGDATIVSVGPIADKSRKPVKKEKAPSKDDEEYKDEDEIEDPELEGYGEETYDYFSRNVAKLGKSAYAHYVGKIKQFLEHDQQYYAVRLFTFMQQSMRVTPDLYEIVILSFLEKGKFSNAFFYLEQMKKSELKPTDGTLNAFISHFSTHPSKSNQTKFEALLTSLGLPTSAPRRR